MRTQRTTIPIAAAALMLAAAPTPAATLSGAVKVGGVYMDEVGDLSTVQETYNLEDGFALARIQLAGTLDPRSSFMLDLRDLNLRSRAGDLAYRVPGRFRLTAGYDQNRYVFDPGRGVTSERKDWHGGLQYTPNPWLSLTGDFNHQTRQGDRLAYPLGTASVLGSQYDDAFITGQVTADVRSGRRGGGLSFRMSDYSDALNGAADRKGQVVAARFYVPMPFYQRWNNLFRGSYGTRELSDGGLEYQLSSFSYTGVLQPRDAYEVRYVFDASRVDDQALDLMTDRFQNDVDATWFHRYGRVSAGYGYEMNDDDRRLTTYQSWRAGATLRPDPRFSALVDYAGRVKKDQEELTLLKDIEASRLRAKLEYRHETLTIGGDYAKRERELPDIGVTVDGTVVGGFVRYELPNWGAASADYRHANDEYVDILAGFETESDIVTGRLEIGRIRNLRVAGGVTYLNMGKDLDIEKSNVFVEAGLTLVGRYHLDAKYNCYNYDDYILITRYYTANVVRVELGYDL
ncbi:MAG TPA: hypothetical protein VFQ05_05395 [Candidatus Eisenbacteria bacterium]|nr:hypothetical protein [Candidatus Eisenbacteria bacterium]